MKPEEQNQNDRPLDCIPCNEAHQLTRRTFLQGVSGVGIYAAAGAGGALIAAGCGGGNSGGTTRFADLSNFTNLSLALQHAQVTGHPTPELQAIANVYQNNLTADQLAYLDQVAEILTDDVKAKAFIDAAFDPATFSLKYPPKLQAILDQITPALLQAPLEGGVSKISTRSQPVNNREVPSDSGAPTRVSPVAIGCFIAGYVFSVGTTDVGLRNCPRNPAGYAQCLNACNYAASAALAILCTAVGTSIVGCLASWIGAPLCLGALLILTLIALAVILALWASCADECFQHFCPSGSGGAGG